MAAGVEAWTGTPCGNSLTHLERCLLCLPVQNVCGRAATSLVMLIANDGQIEIDMNHDVGPVVVDHVDCCSRGWLYRYGCLTVVETYAKSEQRES